MDNQVERNAFGRQIDSFEIDLEISVLKSSANKNLFTMPFLSPPLIEKVAKT
jgi:5'-phosphate synthase pdxT subunit